LTIDPNADQYGGLVRQTRLNFSRGTNMLLQSRNIVLSILLLFAASAQGQSPDRLIAAEKKLIASALDKWDALALQKARAHFERLLTAKQHGALVRYYLGYCDYRLVTFYQRKNDREPLQKHLDEAINQLETAVKINNKFAEANALFRVVTGRGSVWRRCWA
jgi:hypothetical protein